MSEWSPPSVPRSWLVGVGVAYLLVFAYAVVIAQQILFGLFLVIPFVVLYFSWRFLIAVEGITDALQRIARQYEEN